MSNNDILDSPTRENLLPKTTLEINDVWNNIVHRKVVHGQQ